MTERYGNSAPNRRSSPSACTRPQATASHPMLRRRHRRRGKHTGLGNEHGDVEYRLGRHDWAPE
jgi:hypothetical protein